MTDSVDRFSNRVANYVKYRPQYPREIVQYLVESYGLTPESVVADIGCGTGISSRIFLENGNKVFGVEPNAAMRSAAEAYLHGFTNFVPVDGLSTATTLEDSSIDFVVAAQAFHWFEPEPTRAEFKRFLKPGGYAVLIWNERQLDSTPFHRDYEALLQKYANDYDRVRHENIESEELTAFFEGPYKSTVFPNHQIFDFEGLNGRLLSASYMPTEDDPRFKPLGDELASLFAKHAENGRIKVLYDTRVYSSQF